MYHLQYYSQVFQDQGIIREDAVLQNLKAPIIFYQSIREKPGIFGVDRKQMWVVDGKQEIYLEWP